MRYTFLVPNWADRYQGGSSVLYGYLSIAIKIYSNEKEWFIFTMYTFTTSMRILAKIQSK